MALKYVIPILLLTACATVPMDEPQPIEAAHFHEVYRCDKLLFVYGATPDGKAAVAAASRPVHPRIGEFLVETRKAAKEAGHAYRVDNDRGCGTDI